MNAKKQYNGLDILKVSMAVLVASRHMVQMFFLPDSRWQMLMVSWLSNLAVPLFFTAAGFFLFGKISDGRTGQEDGQRIVFRYCRRILYLYLLWTALYLPVWLDGWHTYGETAGKRLLTFTQLFLFSSPIPQLWYLPALAVACLLIWLLLSRGVKTGPLLCITGILFIAGCIGDNWYFNQQLPSGIRHLLFLYCRYFLTMRNGIFYGAFFVCLGLWFSRTRRRLPLLPAALGAVLSVYLMYREVIHCYNTNMVFFSAPAAFFLFSAASSLRLKDRKLYPRLRGMSEWIYLFHFYLYYILAWTSGHNPIPFTERNVTVMALGTLLLFSWCMVRLSECRIFCWLKKMI